MDALRTEYVSLVHRWGELDYERQELQVGLNVFDKTRGTNPPSDAEVQMRRRLLGLINECLHVATRAERLAQIRTVFPRLHGRASQLKNQRQWFEAIKDLNAAKMDFFRVPKASDPVK